MGVVFYVTIGVFWDKSGACRMRETTFTLTGVGDVLCFTAVTYHRADNCVLSTDR